MKLLFNLDSGVYPHKVGGMEIFNYYLIKNIKDKFDIYYTATSPLKIENTKWLKTFNIKPTKIFSPLQVLLKLLFNPSIKKVVISYSAAHWLIWYLYTLINTLLKREYYVIIHYGDATPKGSHKTYHRFFDNAKKVIAVSNDIKKNYDSKYNINCEILYPLVPFEKCKIEKATLREEYDIPANAHLITMVGSIKGMKNPDTLLDALSKLTREEIKRHNIHVAYAGKGNMVETLKKKAQENGLSENVHFLGFVPKEEVNKVLRMTDTYIIASDFEGTSVSLLEAMFNQTPIIASNAPGIKDMVKHRHSALLFETRNAANLNICIKELLGNTVLGEELGNNAYKDFISKYSYNDMLNAYINIFNN